MEVAEAALGRRARSSKWPASCPSAVLADADGKLHRARGEPGRLPEGARGREAGPRRAEAARRRPERCAWPTHEPRSRPPTAPAPSRRSRRSGTERCLFPKKAKDAAKELKKLGSPVADETADAAAPSRSDLRGPGRRARRGDDARKACAARAGGKYAGSRAALRRAPSASTRPIRRPCATWASCTATTRASGRRRARSSRRCWPCPRDPLSRAVALHGLGKMTIHEGSLPKGLRAPRGVGAGVPAGPRLPQPRRLLELGRRRGEDRRLRRGGPRAGPGGRLQPRLRRRLHGRERTAATRRCGSPARTSRCCRPRTTWPRSTPRTATRRRALALLKRHFFDVRALPGSARRRR